MNWLDYFEEEDQIFIKNFILNSGSIKKLEKEYDVSYPTIRQRIDQIRQKLELIELNNRSPFEVSILDLSYNNEISLDTAKKIIEIYNKTIEGDE